MGAIGERKMQELIDRAAADVARGTPQDIASRGLFEACAEVLEGQEDLEHRAEKAETVVDDYEKAVEGLRKNVKELLDEDVGYGDPEPGDILDAYKTLAQEIEELRAGAKEAEAEQNDLEKMNRALEERIALAADEIKRLADDLTTQQQRALEAEERNVALTARLRELEPAGEERAALIERVRYLEAGIGRALVQLYKFRKGAL